MRVRHGTRLEITVETQERLIVYPGPNGVTARCEVCGGTRALVTLPVAAVLAKITERALYREIEARSFHWTEGPRGRLLVCLASLESWLLTRDSTWWSPRGSVQQNTNSKEEKSNER